MAMSWMRDYIWYGITYKLQDMKTPGIMMMMSLTMSWMWDNYNYLQVTSSDMDIGDRQQCLLGLCRIPKEIFEK